MTREQNAWQDGAFRFEHALQSRAYRLDRAEQTRSVHSSPRAQEYAQNARGHRSQDSSQALGQVSSLDSCSRTSKLEPRSQTARVGALKRKNFFQSNSQWSFCATATLKKSFAPPSPTAGAASHMHLITNRTCMGRSTYWKIHTPHHNQTAELKLAAYLHLICI